jgi:YHS domain-containing protein
MNRILTTAGAFLILASCNTSTPKTETPKEEAAFKFTVAQLSTTKDYVCGMDLDTDEMIADTMLLDGKIYGFCHTGCKEEFAKNPQNYLSQNQQ